MASTDSRPPKIHGSNESSFQDISDIDKRVIRLKKSTACVWISDFACMILCALRICLTQGCTTFSGRGPNLQMFSASRAASQLVRCSAKKNNNTNNDIIYCTAVCFTNKPRFNPNDLIFSERLSLNAVNNFVDIWFEFCCRQPQNWTEIIVRQVRSQLILVRVHYRKRFSHKYVLLNSDNNRQSK